jgi:N-acetylglucosaminyldiphosphoundecaprenol N-acetyl-beta-D-mannosaminyltransferase
VTESSQDQLNLRTRRLFGVDIHAADIDAILGWIDQVVRSGEKGYVVTPNVDHIVRLQQDPAFRRAYQQASLVVPDSTPLMWAARLLGRPLAERGSNLLMDVCALVERNGYGLFLLGGAEPILDRAMRNLRRRFPAIRIVGSHHGYFENDAEVLREIDNSSADVLLVALGSPKQELWITSNWARLDVRVGICVGGAFNYVAGAVSRAPRWMQVCGLEWFWRFLHEPRRLWKRYFVYDLAFVKLVIRDLLRPSAGRSSPGGP